MRHTQGRQNGVALSPQCGDGLVGRKLVHAPPRKPVQKFAKIQRETARLIRSSRLDNPDALLDLLQPNSQPFNRELPLFFDSDLERVVAAQQARLELSLADTNSSLF